MGWYLEIPFNHLHQKILIWLHLFELFLCKYLYQKPFGRFVHDTDLNTLCCFGLLSEFKDVLEDF